VFKKIKVLSGGEKSRVALAKTLISEANFLLLDEPTNHLDFISENILIQALQQYQGSFVTVSHNRHFVTQIANKIWYIENHELKEYPGTYEEYEYWRKKNEANVAPVVHVPKKEVPKKEPKPVAAESQNKLNALNKDLAKIEAVIQKLAKEKEVIETELSKQEVYSNPDRLLEAQQKFEKVDAQLEEENKKWESIALEIEEIEGK